MQYYRVKWINKNDVKFSKVVDEEQCDEFMENLKAKEAYNIEVFGHIQPSGKMK